MAGFLTAVANPNPNLNPSTFNGNSALANQVRGAIIKQNLYNGDASIQGNVPRRQGAKSAVLQSLEAK